MIHQVDTLISATRSGIALATDERAHCADLLRLLGC